MKAAIIGIHTGIGKTISSAVLCEALEADYWKPVQAGSLENTDSDIIRKLISNFRTVIHPEGYRLTAAMSPHAAGKIDGVEVNIKSMKLPATNNHLIIETAGGLMSPVSNKHTNLDAVMHFGVPVILISQNYLGSINHTLLTLKALKAHEVKVLGVMFNGNENIDSQDYITGYFKVPVLGRINYRRNLNKEAIQIEAQNIRLEIEKYF